MIDKIQHIGIPTNNIKQVKEYFIDYLGFKIKYETVFFKGDSTVKPTRVIFLEYWDLVLEIYEVSEDEIPTVIGNIDHIEILHESIDMGDIITTPGSIRLKLKKSTSKKGLNYIALNTNDIPSCTDYFNKLGFNSNLLRFNYTDDKNLLTNGFIDHIAIDVNGFDNEQTEYLPFFNNGVRFLTIVGHSNIKIEYNQIL